MSLDKQTSVSKYGTAIINHMNNEKYECWLGMWGDGFIVDACAHLFTGVNRHPMCIMQAAVNGVARDDRFYHRKSHGLDMRGRERVVRSFELKEEYRNRKVSKP